MRSIVIHVSDTTEWSPEELLLSIAAHRPAQHGDPAGQVDREEICSPGNIGATVIGHGSEKGRI